MKKGSYVRTALAIVALLVLATSVEADTFKVPKGGPIQPVIDAAGPGDKVVVRSGLYQEALVIPSSKPGLILKGSRKAIIEPRPGGAKLGTAITVLADGAQVVGFTIRHPVAQEEDEGKKGDGEVNPDGHGVYVDAFGVLVQKATIKRTEGHGVHSVGSSTKVDKCRFDGAGMGSVYSQGSDPVVTRNLSRRSMGHVINLWSDGAIVTKNKIFDGGGHGVIVRAEKAGPLVERNRIFNTTDADVWIRGDNAVVQRNKLLGSCPIVNVYVEGERPVVSRNRVDARGGHQSINAIGFGFLIEKNKLTNIVSIGIRAEGDDGDVIKNSIKTGQEGSTGISTIGQLTEIVRNKIRDVSGTAINQFGIEAVISKNSIKRCGAVMSSSIHSQAQLSGVEITDNKVRDSMGPAITVNNPSGATIARNKLTRGVTSGLRLTGDVGEGASGNLLEGNKLTRFEGDAIQNYLFDTGLKDNKVRKSRLPITNDNDGGATIDDLGGNNFLELGPGDVPDLEILIPF